MTVIVRDDGFHAEDFIGDFLPLDALDGPSPAVDVPSDTATADLVPLLSAGFVRIDFPAFSDGRGFTLGRELRRLGFSGRLRAKGHVIADQYAMVRRSGFDEVEIASELAARQPEDQWLARADWREHDYQRRLRG